MNKIKCPNCSQYKIQSTGSNLMIGTAGLIVIGILLIPFAIGIPLLIFAPFAFLIGLFMRVTGMDVIQCRNCKKRFTKKEVAELLVK